MLFKSPCCLRSDSCSILFLQYLNDGDMDESKGGPRKVHDHLFHQQKNSQTEGREFHRNVSEDLVVFAWQGFPHI